MEFQSKIYGLDEIEKLLKLLPDKPARAALEAGMRAGGKIIQQDAINRAPTLAGPPRIVSYRGKKRLIIPGTLKKSIVVKKVKVPLGQKIAAVLFTVMVTKLAFYAHWVEWGTEKMKAMPFMRPALDTKGPEAIQAIRDVTLKYIAREAEKLADMFGTNKRKRR